MRPSFSRKIAFLSISGECGFRADWPPLRAIGRPRVRLKRLSEAVDAVAFLLGIAACVAGLKLVSAAH
mgnify:FL=1